MSNSQDNNILSFRRGDASHPDFAPLVVQLNQELALRDGADHAFYDQFNSIASLHHVVIGYFQDAAVCCGGFKMRDHDHIEVKRMYTVSEYRGRGFGLQLLYELETWAASIGATSALLETGKRQPEAIRLYQKAGYQVIENYAPYIGVENSLCFEKLLRT